MSNETWYAVRRADGKFLVVVKTPLGARLAMWIDNIELATHWPFMTGATLEMGLDLDPALQAERGGWDVVPVQRREAPAKIVQFAIAIPALLLCLLFAQPAIAQVPTVSHFDWTPVIAVAAGQSLDAISTVRFLSNGSGCTESNAHFGPTPSAAKMLGTHAAVIAGAVAFQALTGRSDSKPIRVIGQSVAYFLGAVGTKSGIRNLRLCGV